MKSPLLWCAIAVVAAIALAWLGCSLMLAGDALFLLCGAGLVAASFALFSIAVSVRPANDHDRRSP